MNYNYAKRKFGLGNLRLFYSVKNTGPLQIPFINRQVQYPDRLIRFSDITHSHDYQAGVHFFIDDFRFECLWNNYEKNVYRLRKYAYILSPDFSIYENMPVAQQIWNTYRSRLLGAAMQSLGLNVIPSVSWSNASSFDFCFDGIEEKSVVAISTRGILRKKSDANLFSAGFKEMIVRIKPSTVLVYGKILPCMRNDSVRICCFQTCKNRQGEVSYLTEGE